VTLFGLKVTTLSRDALESLTGRTGRANPQLLVPSSLREN